MIVGRTWVPLPNPQRLHRENGHSNIKGPLEEDEVAEAVFVWEGQQWSVGGQQYHQDENFILFSPSLSFGNLSKITALDDIVVIGSLRLSHTQFIQNLFVLGHLMDITRKVTVLIWDTVSSSSLLPLSTQDCWIQLQLDEFLGSL